MSKKNILIIILFVLFIGLVILIKTGLITSFDTSVYNLVASNINDTATFIYKIFTFLGSTAYMIGLGVLFLVLFIILKKNYTGYIITGCLIISTIVNNVVKIIIRRPRPEVLRLVVEKSFSFPSGHTMAAVSIYGILLYLILKSKINTKLKWILSIILVILPIMVGISRIYLGAHFASDIIGAAIMSIILLLIETSIINKYKLLEKDNKEK